MSELEERLRAIVRESDALMSALRAARAVGLPDWYIGAGAVRDLVWDRLHDRAPRAPRDVDVAFFDPSDLRRLRDHEAQEALARALPGVPWEATNQAAVHLWYEAVFGVSVPPLASCDEALATWPETVTCIGVRLRDDDAIEICAPLGLEDLFELVWRYNPVRASLDAFERRLARKDVAQRWPRARIVR
ncbi:MAG: nucleotidyltransferase family protein [Myxococcota bacterium]|nr:nucleotidyltransferase family protein [Myxococcota bacterium]